MSKEIEDKRAETAAPEASQKPHWIRGALTRGFLAAAQEYHAANLVILRMLPRKAQNSWLTDKLTGDRGYLSRKITEWEHRMDRHMPDPALGPIKTGLSKLFFNAANISPIIALSAAAALALGPTGGFSALILLNGHSSLGEAFIQTAHGQSVKLKEQAALDKSLLCPKFSDVATKNAFVKTGICLGFILAAGPLARMFSTASTGFIRGLARSPVGRFASEQLLNETQTKLVTSLSKSIGKKFSDAAIGNGKGTAALMAKMTGAVIFIRSATNMVYNRVTGNPVESPAMANLNVPEIKTTVSNTGNDRSPIPT